MASTLINVRLNAADARKVKRLRDEGVVVSEIVRDAIRDAYEKRRRNGRQPKRDVRKILQAIYEQFPIPSHVPPPGIDLADRRAVSRAIVKRLKRKRP